VLHHASRNVLPGARRYRPKAYCKDGGVAAEAETSDGLLELSDAIGLVRQQLVAAQLEARRVVAGKVAAFAVGKVALELTGEIKTRRLGCTDPRVPAGDRLHPPDRRRALVPLIHKTGWPERWRGGRWRGRSAHQRALYRKLSVSGRRDAIGSARFLRLL
jgi:hypothetical protein